MATAFSYKRSTTTNMKLCGILDTDNGTIDIEGESKVLLSLLKDFNGADVSVTVSVKEEQELSEPSED